MRARSFYGIVIVLAVLATAVSLFLTYSHYASAGTACPKLIAGQKNGCDGINESIYSEIVGIPVAGIGVLGYMAIGAFGLIGLGWLKPKGNLFGDIALHPAFYMMLFALGGFMFTLYLNFIQFFVIGQICFLCEISAVIITLLLILAVILWRWERTHGETRR